MRWTISRGRLKKREVDFMAILRDSHNRDAQTKSSGQAVFNSEAPQQTVTRAAEIIPSACGLINERKIIAVGLRRYLKREGLALLKQAEGALEAMEAQLRKLDANRSSNESLMAQHRIEAQRRRIAKATRNILAL